MQHVSLPWEADPIGFLIDRKFPSRSNRLASAKGDPSVRQEPDADQAADAYFAELVAMPPNEVGKLLEAEKALFLEDLAVATKMLDDGRFFNESFCVADLEHWSKISYWTADEAVALSMGRDPRLVSWETIRQYAPWSFFVSTYGTRRDLVLRAIEAGQIGEKTAPSYFLAWAVRTRFPMPGEIVRSVEEIGNQIADWKSEYDRLVAFVSERVQESERTQAQLEAEKSEAMAALAYLDAVYGEVLERCASLEKAANESKAPARGTDSLGTRERDTLLKLVIGMATKGYGFDPKVQRSTVIPEIAVDLEAAGVTVTDDTVRKYLREAAALLSASD